MYLVTLKNAILAASLSLNALAGVYFYNNYQGNNSKENISQPNEVVKIAVDNAAATSTVETAKIQPVKPIIKSKKRKSTTLKPSQPIPVAPQPMLISEMEVALEEIQQKEESVISVTHTTILAETAVEPIIIEQSNQIADLTSTQTTTNIDIIEDLPIASSEAIVDASISSTAILNEENINTVKETKEDSKSEVDDQQRLSVKINLQDPTNLKVVWADNTGKIVNISNSTYPKGIQKINIKTEEIHPGTYTINLLNAASNETLKSIRFVK